MIRKEELLNAWLYMSANVWNRRIVRKLSFNEAFVCNLLYRKWEEPDGGKITATYLCEETRLLKSQMNKIINKLEDEGIVERRRSQSDKRRVYIFFTEKGRKVYEEEHNGILNLLGAIMEKFSEEEVNGIYRLFHTIADGVADYQNKIDDAEE